MASFKVASSTDRTLSAGIRKESKHVKGLSSVYCIETTLK